jgi:hypothetical protein
VALCYRRGHTLEILPVDEGVWVHHNAGLLNEEDITYLEGLPMAIKFELEGTDYGMTHMYQEYDEIVSLQAFRNFCKPLGRIPSTPNHRSYPPASNPLLEQSRQMA